jgi:hypothetical protein
MHLDGDDDGNGAGAAAGGARRCGPPSAPTGRPWRRWRRRGIISGLDLAHLNSSRSGGSLRKVAAEATAIGARVFANLEGTLLSPMEMLPWQGNGASSSAIVAAPAMGGGWRGGGRDWVWHRSVVLPAPMDFAS